MGNQTSKQSKDRSRKNVHWKSAEPPQPPGKPFLMPGLPTDEPDVVTIKWERPKSDNGSTIIGYIVEHRRTGSPHWVRACPQLVQFTELALSGLEPGWRYQFRVVAENAVGRSEPSEPSDPLTVTLQRNAISAPRFTIELEDFNGIENEKVEFKVSVIATPPPQISWFKDGFEIFSSRRTKIITENDSSTLVFYQASLTDEGEVKCTATNRAGYSFTKANLTIEAPPKIRLPRQYEDGLIIEAEEVIRLKVGLAGRPTPTVIWTHNGEMIESNGRYEITNSDKNSSLKITNSNRTDRGEYNLRAINKLGEDNSSFLVTVTARPTPPGKVAIKILLGKTVTLSWAPPEDDGGCKIGNYIVEYFRVGWGVWLKAATCRQLAVTLNDMIEGSEYKFRVKAENPYGVSEPSEESDVLFIPDPKRGITQPDKDKKVLTLEQAPVAPKRRNPSPSPARTKSPAPRKELNTKIFDDDTIEHDLAYGSADDYYNFREVSSSSLHEKNGFEEQVRQSRSTKLNVKFKLDVEKTETKTLTTSVRDKPEAIYENLKLKTEEKPKSHSEVQTSGKRTYLDLSKAIRKEPPSSIQNSSEFMLVLYPDKESKNSTKSDYELDMEEYFAPPPPLSQSAPELNVTMPEGPFMRAAVSSTELLYERAMARFYKAVEYEETENARKRSMSIEPDSRRRSLSVDQEAKRLSIQADPQEAALMRLRINSLTETEKASTLKRRLSGDNPNLQLTIPRRLSFKDDEDDQSSSTQLNTIRNELNTPEIIAQMTPQLLTPPKAHSENLSDDYSDSTVSSAEEENENEIPTRRSRQRSNEMHTYHPRVLSPYRLPENSEAANVLTKPLPPLPDPNFVPKPILKRPASADGRRSTPNKPERKTLTQLLGRRSASSSPNPSPRSQRKSVEIDEIPKFIQPREDFEPEPISKPVPQIKVEEPKAPIEPEPEPELEPVRIIPPEIIKRKEAEKRKMLEQRQISIEENKVMASFYGDMIKDLSVRPVKKIPIYMDPEALKNLEVDDEEELQNDSGITSSTDMSPQSTLSRPFSPPMGGRKISETKPPEKEIVAGRRLAANKSELNVEAPLKDNLQISLTLSKTQPNDKQLELNRSPSPQRPFFSNGPLLQKHEQISSTSSIDDVQSRGRGLRSKTGAVPKRRNQSQSRSRDSSSVRTGPPAPVIPKSPMESTILSRRDKSASRTRNRSESKSPATLNRRIIINRMAPPKPVITDLSPPARTVTPSELQEQVQLQVKSTITHTTDVTILIFATYVYFFKSAILALPILMLLLYRQISDRLPDWMKRKKS